MHSEHVNSEAFRQTDKRFLNHNAWNRLSLTIFLQLPGHLWLKDAQIFFRPRKPFLEVHHQYCSWYFSFVKGYTFRVLDSDAGLTVQVSRMIIRLQLPMLIKHIMINTGAALHASVLPYESIATWKKLVFLARKGKRLALILVAHR